MLSDFLTGALVGAVIVGIVVIIALMRKLPAKTAAPTARRLTLTSPLSPKAVFEKLKNASWRRIEVHDTDPDRNVLVLATSMSGFSWGFFYPVFITASGSGSTIEIGIKSRAVQWGPVVGNNHQAAVAEIERMVKA